MPLYNDQITLINEIVTEDEIGNREVIETSAVVFCSLKDIGANAFYQAAAAGMKPSFIATVRTFEYSGEQKVIYENVEYKVIRTYRVDHEETELTCEKVN